MRVLTFGLAWSLTALLGSNRLSARFDGRPPAPDVLLGKYWWSGTVQSNVLDFHVLDFHVSKDAESR